MKLILTRHWETEETKSGILQWHLPGKLTQFWIEQASNLAKNLEKENIDLIFSSDLARSLDTAKIIQNHLKNIQLISSELLREKAFWIFEWKNKNEIWFYDSDKKHIFDNPPEWENMKQVITRAKIFLEEIREKYPNNTILIVSHDDISRALISVITWEKIENTGSIEKCGVRIFN